jgi:hypothetical protein
MSTTVGALPLYTSAMYNYHFLPSRLSIFSDSGCHVAFLKTPKLSFQVPFTYSPTIVWSVAYSGKSLAAAGVILAWPYAHMGGRRSCNRKGGLDQRSAPKRGIKVSCMSVGKHHGLIIDFLLSEKTRTKKSETSLGKAGYE